MKGSSTYMLTLMRTMTSHIPYTLATCSLSVSYELTERLTQTLQALSEMLNGLDETLMVTRKDSQKKKKKKNISLLTFHTL